jgi:tetratricopeptide (TPR) repeat protein
MMLSEELRPYRKALVDAGLREALALVQDLEGDPRAELQRLQAYEALGRVQSESGDKSSAVATIRKAIALAESLVQRDPSDRQARHGLANALHIAATFLLGDEGQALARRSNEILRSIRKEDPDGNSPVLTAMNHFNLGDMYARKGDSSRALPELLAARAAYDEAIARGDRSPQVLDYAAYNLMYLCRLLGTAQPEESLAAGRRAEEIFQSLVREHPERFEFALFLALAQQELGNHFLAVGQAPAAIRSFEAVRRTLQDMTARHGKLVSKMAEIQGRLAVADFNLREAYESDPVRYARARRELAVEAHEICDKLSLVEALEWNLLITRAVTAFALADYQAEDGRPPDLDLILEAERTWEGMLRRSSKFGMARTNLVVVRRRLAAELLARGQPDEAAHWERRALETVVGDPERPYAIAVEYARNAGLVGKYPTKLDERQLRVRRRRFEAEAVGLLRQAVADGFRDPARLKSEPLLDAIRSNPEFRAIVSGLEFPADPFAPR